MDDLFTKTLTLGLGALNLTKEKAEHFVDELVRRGQVPKQEAANVVETLLQRGEEETRQLKGTVMSWLQQALNDAGLATRAQVEALESRIAVLEGGTAAAGETAPTPCAAADECEASPSP